MKVVANRKEVLAKVKANKEQHIINYNKAVDGWYVNAKEVLEEALLEVAAKEKNINPSLGNYPTSYARHYDIVIAMLEINIEDNIELTKDEVSKYICDEWEWKDVWDMSNTYYMSKSISRNG